MSQVEGEQSMDMQKMDLSKLAKNPVFILLFLLIVGLLGPLTRNLAVQKALPDTLTVTRVTLRSAHIAPFSSTTHDAAVVQKLYKAAYALPTPLPDQNDCQSSSSLEYDLTFLQRSLVVQKMYLTPTGCPRLNIGTDVMGIPDMRVATTAFQSLLAQALGLPSLVPTS